MGPRPARSAVLMLGMKAQPHASCSAMALATTPCLGISRCFLAPNLGSGALSPVLLCSNSPTETQVGRACTALPNRSTLGPGQEFFDSIARMRREVWFGHSPGKTLWELQLQS